MIDLTFADLEVLTQWDTPTICNAPKTIIPKNLTNCIGKKTEAFRVTQRHTAQQLAPRNYRRAS